MIHLPLLVLILLTTLFALMAIRARALLLSAIWLATASATLATCFYLLGAHIVAVIELSVGAGLVTVLFVFAINIIGDGALSISKPMPPWLALWASIGLFLMLSWLVYPQTGLTLTSPGANTTISDANFADAMWAQRGLDVVVQLGLMFSGVLALLGILAEAKAPLQYPLAEEAAQKRRQELDRLSQPRTLSPEPSKKEA